jgi:hypothetical protein
MAEPPRPLAFPLARTTPPRTLGGFKELGTTALARTLGLAEESLYGHWCRPCQGIWWGLPLGRPAPPAATAVPDVDQGASLT